MFRIYDQHRGRRVPHGPVPTLAQARRMAEAAARRGHTAFFRVFEITDEGERYVVAYSVRNGRVREVRDAGFPPEHR